MDYLSETAIDSLKGEDIIKVAPQKYSSTVEYPNTRLPAAQGLAQTHIAEIGSRMSTAITAPSTRMPGRTRGTAILWKAVSEGVDAFMAEPARAQQVR